jgi:hypothetical protein
VDRWSSAAETPLGIDLDAWLAFDPGTLQSTLNFATGQESARLRDRCEMANDEYNVWSACQLVNRGCGDSPIPLNFVQRVIDRSPGREVLDGVLNREERHQDPSFPMIAISEYWWHAATGEQPMPNRSKTK